MSTESAGGPNPRIVAAAVGTTALLVGSTLFWLWREHAPLSRHVRRENPAN